MQTKTDVQNTLSFISQILTQDVMPFFNINSSEYGVTDLSNVLSKFLTLQNSISELYLNVNDSLDNNLSLIDQKINSSLTSLLALDTIDYRMMTNPTASVNPLRGVGAIWLNFNSGEIFVCTNNTDNKNVWRGSNGSTFGFNTRLSVDPLNDGSCKARFSFNNNYSDLLGLTTLSLSNGDVSYFDGKFDKCCRER
jgi:hypothetical protein